ncbi:MAG TPA: ATP-binding protein [Egibacteraceae bacterium]|nr:ATP-binding protein [Egibacteraceae bacterium]
MTAGAPRTTQDARYPLAFRVYLGLLIAGTAVFLPAGIGEAVRNPLQAVLWIGFIAGANLLVIPMLPKLDIDASLGAPVGVAAAVVLPPPFAMLVNLIGFTNERELRGQAQLWMSAFNRTQMGLTAAAASYAAMAMPGPRVAVTLGAVVVYNVVNTVAVALSLWTRGLARLPKATVESAAPFPRFAVDYVLVALLAAFVVIAYDTVGVWAVAMLALPLLIGYSALRSAREAEDRAEQLAARVADLETLNSLSADLLTVRDRTQLPRKAAEALRNALATRDVEVTLSGEGRSDLRTVPVLGAEPAAVRVPHDLDDSALAVVEAIAGLIGMAVQRLELERELSEVERARAALSGRILEEGTRERSRIALEIHDEVLPYLAAAGIQADNVRSALVAGDEVVADRLADATREAVHDGITRLRQVLDALQRQIVVPGGLRPGLVDALEELRLKHGVDGELRAEDPLPPLPLAVEILVLETVRGCLANVALHARADRVEVSLAVSERFIAVDVRDDGCGFDPTATDPGSHGLALMSQRVELARGRFTVDSSPGRGTTVQVEVPV